MGWASGSALADDAWAAFEEHIMPVLEKFIMSDECIKDFAAALAAAFEDQDCDTLEECNSPIGDASNRMMHESYGAPQDAEAGAIYQDPDDAAYRFRFNGKRWEYFE